MSNLIPFQYESNQIRVITGEDEEPLFVAKDVAEPLGYAWSGIRTIQHIPEEWRRVESVSTPQGMQDLHVLTEQGLYFFLARSDKPKALPFQKWIAGDVIPSIRKTGSYSLKPKSALELAKEQVALLEHLERIERERDDAIRTKAWIGARREATAMATASKEARRAEKLEQELDRSKEYVTIKRMSMIYHGQKFDWRRLKSTGIEMGIEPIDVFDSNYGTVKAYHVDVWREAYAIGLPETAA
jgi:prophage antirepressor-like protein